MSKPKPHPRDVGFSEPPDMFSRIGTGPIPDGLGICRLCGIEVINDWDVARLRKGKK